MPQPTLVPVAPTPGAPLALDRSPFWIGGADGAALRLYLPGIADRHVALIEREDGWWASPGHESVTLNGMALTAARLLAAGDTIAVLPGHQYRFETNVALPVPAPAPSPAAPRTRRKPPRHPRRPRRRPPVAVIAVAALALVLVVAAVVTIWYAARAGGAGAILTDQQAQEFDSLLVVAYDHVERGNTLMEMGVPDVAGQEFARGVNTLALSDLRHHPQVKPRIDALEASIAAIYRARRLTVPPAYARTGPTLSPDQLRSASLSVTQFADAFAQVSAAFGARYHTAIDVTGRDHAEHLSLYGPGGALDLRTKMLTPDQLGFLVAQCRGRGIRVKDFSQDSILQRQIQAATAAGLLDRIGTGLHLHIDRFAGRRDRWTVATSPGT